MTEELLIKMFLTNVAVFLVSAVILLCLILNKYFDEWPYVTKVTLGVFIITGITFPVLGIINVWM